MKSAFAYLDSSALVKLVSPEPETSALDGQIDIFGEAFRVPDEAIYAYGRATVDVARQVLTIVLDDRVIDQHRYLLR